MQTERADLCPVLRRPPTNGPIKSTHDSHAAEATPAAPSPMDCPLAAERASVHPENIHDRVDSINVVTPNVAGTAYDA